jgi:hypothetical protein
MTPCKLYNSLLFSDLFLYLSFFLAIGKEEGRWWEIVREDVGCVGSTASFIPCGVIIEEAKWLGSTGSVKRHSKNELMHHSTPRMMHPLHHKIRQSYPKLVPQLPWGPPKLSL